MVGGIVVGITYFTDRVRLLVQGTGSDRNREVVRQVYPTRRAMAVRIDDHVWWQCGVVYWTPSGWFDVETHGATIDTPLVMIRQNYGSSSPWPLAEAARMAGVKKPL